MFLLNCDDLTPAGMQTHIRSCSFQEPPTILPLPHIPSYRNEAPSGLRIHEAESQAEHASSEFRIQSRKRVTKRTHQLPCVSGQASSLTSLLLATQRNFAAGSNDGGAQDGGVTVVVFVIGEEEEEVEVVVARWVR